MPRKGNNGVVGKKGRSGRKSAYQELADATALNDAFYKGVSLKKLQKIGEKIKSKKGTVKMIEFTLWRAFESDRVLCDLLRKVLPDKTEETGKGGLAELLTALHSEKTKKK